MRLQSVESATGRLPSGFIDVPQFWESGAVPRFAKRSSFGSSDRTIVTACLGWTPLSDLDKLIVKPQLDFPSSAASARDCVITKRATVGQCRSAPMR